MAHHIVHLFPSLKLEGLKAMRCILLKDCMKDCNHMIVSGFTVTFDKCIQSKIASTCINGRSSRYKNEWNWFVNRLTEGKSGLWWWPRRWKENGTDVLTFTSADNTRSYPRCHFTLVIIYPNCRNKFCFEQMEFSMIEIIKITAQQNYLQTLKQVADLFL